MTVGMGLIGIFGNLGLYAVMRYSRRYFNDGSVLGLNRGVWLFLIISAWLAGVATAAYVKFFI